MARLRPVLLHLADIERCIAPAHAHGGSNGSSYFRGDTAHACDVYETRSEGTLRRTTFNVRQTCGASRNGRTRQTSAASHLPLTSYHLVVALALEPNSPSSRSDNHRHVRRRATRESQNVTEVQYDFLSYGRGMDIYIQ